ncbi:MAG: leucine-rich repeat domain-containing protein [Lachnospiraceae bacterium]|nr:leucine-rich repeat domain-containing protein [Lachnospiraceae bacterium]
MKLWKRVLVTFLAGTTVTATLPANVYAYEKPDGMTVEAYSSTDEAEIVASGDCGDDATWTLDEDGVLTISGTGEMEDYTTDTYTSIPWYSYNDSINTVVISYGITHVGSYSFYESAMTSISLPDSVESIGSYAFYLSQYFCRVCCRRVQKNRT